MLNTETNTKAMEARVLRAAHHVLRLRKLVADFEHGQWWVTNLESGAQWSVVDCETADGVFYFDFEKVTEGEE